MGRGSRRFLGRRACHRGSGTGEEGITLIELVVAFAVLLIVVVPTALLLQNTMGEAATARERLTALSIAEQCIEKLGNTGPPIAHGLPETNTAFTENAGCAGSTPLVESTVVYDVQGQFTWTSAQGSQPDLCTAATVPSVLALHVWVTWGRGQKVTDATVIDYPPPGLPTGGFLAVQVEGDPAGAPPPSAGGTAWATRVQGVPVTMTSSSFSTTLVPNSYGCVFQQVPPGTYTVSLADPSAGAAPATPSWTANADETTTPSRSSLVVNVGLVTLATFQYDQGAFVTLDYPTSTATDGGATCPSVGAIRCLVFGQAPALAVDPGATPVAELSVRTSSGWKLTVLRASGAVRIVAAACAGTRRCVAVGDARTAGGYVGASVSSPTTSVAFTADGIPSGVGALDAIACPASTACYAAGSGPSGAVLLSGTVTTSGVSWALDTVPANAGAITDLTCPAPSTCYATTSSGDILSLTSATTWAADTVPTTTTSAPGVLRAVACASPTTCYAVGTRASSPAASELSLTSATPTKWVKDSGPSTAGSLTSVECATSGSTTSCHALGRRTVGGASYGAILSLSAPTTWTLDTPASEGSITSITCPSATVCTAVGTTSAGTPLVLWQTGATSFTAEPVPAGTASLSSVACGNSGHCFVEGTSTTSGTSGTSGAVILSGGGATWTLDSLPSDPVALSGIACGATLCEAPGSSETGALYLEGTTTGSGWVAAGPAAAAGLDAAGVPVAVTSSGLQTVSPLEVAVPAATAVVSRAGPLFPFQSGYTVAATECAPLESGALARTIPGGTATVSLPMGLLSLRVVTQSGAANGGATVSAAPRCSVPLSPPAGMTNPSTLALPATDAFGLSEIAVPYGTYSVTVSAGGHAVTVPVSVTPTTISLTGQVHLPSTPLLVVLT